MTAFIFAAGLGTRLKPITDSIPKALVPINGKPLLYYAIQNLKKAGVNRIIINVHHFAQQIIEYIKENNSFDIEILFSDETEKLLETGGAIKKAIPLLNNSGDFIIYNVDIISDIDLNDMLAFHKANKSDATLFVSDRVTARYLLFNNQKQLEGWTNIETKEIKSPHKKLVIENLDKLAFGGIHVFSTKLFPYLDAYPDKFSIIDFYINNCDKAKFAGYTYSNPQIIDVGKLNSLDNAEEMIKNINKSR